MEDDVGRLGLKCTILMQRVGTDIDNQSRAFMH